MKLFYLVTGFAVMPLLKDDKKIVGQKYRENMESAVNVVLLSHNKIPVNQLNMLRMGIKDQEGKMMIVKKRVLMKGIEGLYSGVEQDQLEGSVAMLMSFNQDDEHAPLKVINTFKKGWKKDKVDCSIDYIGGWYDEKEWRGSEYVSELASLPSKEELIGKFLYMLNHPVSSFARVLNAIAEGSGEDALEVTEESVEETKEEVKEEGEVKQEEPKE